MRGIRLRKLGEVVSRTLKCTPRRWKIVEHVGEKVGLRAQSCYVVHVGTLEDALPISRRNLLAAASFGLVCPSMLIASALAPGSSKAQGPIGIPTAQIGGPFRLTDQNGAAVTEQDFKGKTFLVFFGFTHCPEVCPTTLFDISEVMRKLGDDADRTAVVFITVDPDRDTPESLKDYLASFDPHIRGLTGDPAAVAAVAKAYQVYYKKPDIPRQRPGSWPPTSGDVDTSLSAGNPYEEGGRLS
jgi:protein SCO1/2